MTVAPDQLQYVDPSRLPPQLRKLVTLIGVADTVKLLEERGGTFFYFPVKPDGSAFLNSILQYDSRAALSAAFGDQKIELPKADKILTQIRDRAICEALKTKSYSKVALEFNLTRRQIINIKNQRSEGESDLTLDLFPDLHY